MIRPGMFRPFGILLISIGIIGIFISLFSLLQVWRLKPAAAQTLHENLDLVDTTLTTSLDGLMLFQTTLDNLTTNIQSLKNTSQSVSITLDQARPVISSVDNLVNLNLPDTITATQTSLSSAAASAQIMDNMISTIAKIPFLGLGQYAPAVPLHDALNQVSNSLADLRPALSSIHTSMSTASGNLVTLQTEAIAIGESFQKISDNIGQAKGVIQQYQTILQEFQDRISYDRQRLDTWINTVVWAITIVLIWVALTQLGLIIYGLDLLDRNKREVPITGRNANTTE